MSADPAADWIGHLDWAAGMMRRARSHKRPKAATANGLAQQAMSWAADNPFAPDAAKVQREATSLAAESLAIIEQFRADFDAASAKNMGNTK